ncbi:complement component receptor 1-like protein [Mercenaria mercenaria]|uniref:complement component receptor 1-like protein n=1 Tax=Mercenaria mercenaria TaxID=6596 RepID=UPI00234E89B5|nr:complement component receptor 1-like protein [Mercenaria mercenaria]
MGEQVVFDCGLLSVPNGVVDVSLGTIIGSVAMIECNNGYDINGSSKATCIDNGVYAGWNYSVICEQQFCDDPTPINGRVSSTDGSSNYVYDNYAEIECNMGYTINGDSLITCEDGGVWSDNSTCYHRESPIGS